MMRFAAVGVVATVLHYGVYLLMRGVIGMNAAFSAGYVVSFVFNYMLNARYTFRKKRSLGNAIGFCCAHLFNYLLQISLLNIFVWLGVDKAWAPVPVYCVAIPSNFLIVRFVFRKFG